MKRRLFRWHRFGLSESLDSTVEVHSLSQMISFILKDFPADNYLHNIRISTDHLNDSDRCGKEWEERHYVLADFEEYTGQCIGYCNFIADATPQELLEEAIKIATSQHAGQVDKGGMPYILHPLRVMMSVQRQCAIERADKRYWNMCIASVLHDVIEDTTTTYEELSEHGFDKEVINLLTILTKQPDEEYADYITRITESGNRQALTIKLADLRDNMDEERLNQPLSDADKNRLDRYRKAFEKLEAKLSICVFLKETKDKSFETK